MTPAVVWYAEEKIDTSGGFTCLQPCFYPSVPDGVIHALDVVNQTDKIVSFHSGQMPRDIYGNVACCSTEY